MQASGYEPILQRRHSTAHYFQNGTIYILGGIDLNGTTIIAQPMIALRLNRDNFSLHVSAPQDSLNSQYPPIMGHTSHLHESSNAIISVLGLRDKTMSPPLIAIPTKAETFSSNNSNALPNTRYFHTSVLINETLHVVGGSDPITQTPVKDVIWNYSFSTHLWTPQSSDMSSRSGHITIVYYQWLVSCFGMTANGSLTSECTWFDTVAQAVVADNPPVIEKRPAVRKFASMISVSNNKNRFVLFGGQNETAILDDMWYLDISEPFEMNWTRINTLANYKRSAHAATLIDDDVILYYGGQDSFSSSATDPIFFNITNKEWIYASKNNKKKISSGIIAGIVVVIIACILLGLGIVYFVWKKRYQRRQKLRDSRAARFSQSPPSHQLESSIIHYPLNNEKLQGVGLKEGEANFISLPELALHNNNRISTISLGTYSHHSHHSTTAPSPHQTIPKIELNSSKTTTSSYERQKKLPMVPITEGKPVNYKRRESTGFNKLTLNLFSTNSSSGGSQHDIKKSRASSLFQLRYSRLLQPNTPISPKSTDNRYTHKPSRNSASAKSVTSVQWVGFNDTMDAWRRSTGSSLHLAVTNARSSMYFSDSSTQSTPRSPMFPQYLKDAALQHQTSGRDSTKSTPERSKRSTATSDMNKIQISK